MEPKKLWADYSDDWSSDEETEATLSIPATPPSTEGTDSIHALPLPFYIKIFNLPFKLREDELQGLLQLKADEASGLKMLYSKGGQQKKFRGIAVYRVTSYETGGRIMELSGSAFKGRNIRLEVLHEWTEPQPQGPAPKSTEQGRRTCSKYRSGWSQRVKS